MFPNLLAQVLQQWPSLTGVAILALGAWRVFNKFVEENHKIVQSWKELSGQQINSYKDLASVQAAQVKSQSEQISTYQKIISGMLDDLKKFPAELDKLRQDGQENSRRFDEIRAKLIDVMLEYKNLLRIAEEMESTIKEMGGNVQSLSVKMNRYDEDMQDISKQIKIAIGPPRS